MKTIFVIEINSDLTEGKGSYYPYMHCESRSTAERLARGKNTMGSPGIVREVNIFEHQGKKYLPLMHLHIQQATKEDREKDAARKKKEDAMAKAKGLGLTDEDIKALEVKV
jgi:hypothetical protein